ncbi:MAG: SRPBCC family protein [Myxococcota bacterium]|nr:SRPBCC family protein [Myxococcota bacterium]
MAGSKSSKKGGGCLRLVLIGAGLALLVAVGLYAGGYLIDGDVAVGTEARLDAPPETVFPYLATRDGVVAWWERFGETAPEAQGMRVVAVDGPNDAPGAQVRFEMDGTVTEEWTLLEVEPPGRAVWRVDFQIMEVERTFTLVAEGAQATRVSWRETGHIDNPLARYMKLAMGTDEVEANFDLALEGLDRLVRD